MKNSTLQQLKQFVFEGGFDEDSRREVLKLETRIRREVIKQRFYVNTIVAEYMAFLTQEITRCKEILSEDESLTDQQRIRLLERKKACKEFLSHFEPQKEELEKTIKDLLNVAKTEKNT